MHHNLFIQLNKGKNIMDLFSQQNRAEIGTTTKDVVSYFQTLFEPQAEFYPVDLFYFDERCKLDYSLWRLDRGFIRYYFNPANKNFHASVTSIIGDQEPNKPWLNKWQSDMGGYDEAEEYKNTRADYGELLHILINEAPMIGSLNVDMLKFAVDIFVEKNEIEFRDTRYWHEDLANDLAGFFQWWFDYEVVPYASEVPIIIPVFHPRTKELLYVTSGTPDLVCELNAKNYTDKTPKYKRNRVKAVIDFKSGRKGFWENHQIQREVYMKGWNFNMRNHISDFRSTRSFICTHSANWAPTNSRGNKTTYKFKMSKGTEKLDKFANWVDNFVGDGKHEVSPVRRIKGHLKIGESTDANIVYEDAGEFLHNRWKEYQDRIEAEQQNQGDKS